MNVRVDLMVAVRGFEDVFFEDEGFNFLLSQ